MLREQDKQAIDACTSRPESVWEGIKSIITADKYTWYLESLAQVHIVSNIAERKAKWDGMDADARSKYMKTQNYDEDLKKVLQQVAKVLGGVGADDFPIGANIGNWRKIETQYMQRQIAFKAAVAFRFTIEETRKLLFTVLEDNEQMDFNPRLPNEMIYAYVIIIRDPKNKVLIKEKPQELAQNMLREVQKKYLKELLGNSDSDCFDDLILVAGDSFNLLDSLNMTRTAYSLAIIKYIHYNQFTVENAKLILQALLNDAAFSPRGIAEIFAIIIDKNNFSEDDIKKVLVALVIEGSIHYQNTADIFAETLIAKQMLSNDDRTVIFAPYAGKQKRSVVLSSDEVNAYLSLLTEKSFLSVDYVEVLLDNLRKMNSNRKKRLMPDSSITQKLYENTYGNNIFEQERKPDFGAAKRNSEIYLKMFRLADRYLNAAVKHARSTDTDVYKKLLGFVGRAQHFVSNNEQPSPLSPLDFLPLLEDSGFDDLDGVISAIKTKLIAKYIEEATRVEQKDEYEVRASSESNGQRRDIRSGDYHVTSTNHKIISNEEVRYFTFFWKMMIEGTKNLCVCLERNLLFFWYVYTEMNRILLYPYYDSNGICARVIEHYCQRREREPIQYHGEVLDGYTYTLNKINDALGDIEFGLEPSELISGMMEDIHCFEYFNQVFISRGNDEFVRLLYESDVLDSLGVLGKEQPEYLRRFYCADTFREQFEKRSIPYKRKDILKLAFWQWVNDADNLDQGPASRKASFVTFFDKLIQEKKLCCAPSNTYNPLDKFLSLCIAADDPILFLKEAIEYSDKLKRIF